MAKILLLIAVFLFGISSQNALASTGRDADSSPEELVHEPSRPTCSSSGTTISGGHFPSHLPSGDAGVIIGVIVLVLVFILVTAVISELIHQSFCRPV
ncbi:MAG: hypothetical protein HRU19_22020 [Pseudobacteriovorax sp.]|nr:hypothetical protein [Pseudobacteriovorax sp.]